MINIEKDALNSAVRKWGSSIQADMLIEEMAELTKEVCKYKRGRNNIAEITEEIADVFIMLEQAKIIFSISDNEISDMVDMKMVRLKLMLMQ
jgi:NTP pyrophosphatase (non-canonical NTP hydrolase)